jgi:hypothetical protein
MFRCQLSNEFGLGHLSGEEVPHRAVVITEKQRAFEPTLSCGGGELCSGKLGVCPGPPWSTLVCPGLPRWSALVSCKLRSALVSSLLNVPYPLAP